MKNVLITGGCGFIGSHLCDFYIQKKYKIICMDNLITGNINNINHLQKHKNFTFINHDITRYIEIPGKIDYILHFASPASPVDYHLLPIQTLKVGALGTHNVLGVAKAKKATVLLASTSEIYGDPLEHPQKESYWGNVNPIGPRGCYDESKRFLEAITMAYNRVHKVKTRMVRIFNTYGPRMRINDGRVIPNFISQALNNQPITVYGKGTQTRSFCFVDDLIRGIDKLLLSSYELPVNLGNPKERTVLNLAKLIIKMTGSKSKIIYNPLPQDDPRQRKPNIALAKKLLKWEPKIAIQTGLENTIQYFKHLSC